MANKILIKRGLKASLPALNAGELAVTTDTGNVQLWVGTNNTTAGNTQIGGPGLKPGSHTHDASDITAGTLSVARGGTGLTSSPSLLVNLGTTSAANVLAASPRPGVTGTLPIANGGTGATTAAQALKNLGGLSIVGSGTAAPTSNIGSNGDVYLQYV